MSFMEEIKRSLGLEDFSTGLYRAVLIDGCAGYFENVCGVKSYKREQVVLSLKKGELIIKGENLTLKKYCAGDVVVCGKINSLERV